MCKSPERFFFLFFSNGIIIKTHIITTITIVLNDCHDFIFDSVFYLIETILKTLRIKYIILRKTTNWFCDDFEKKIAQRSALLEYFFNNSDEGGGEIANKVFQSINVSSIVLLLLLLLYSVQYEKKKKINYHNDCKKKKKINL